LKILLRLYPRSWRARYGGEMEDLVDHLPSRPSVAVDLLFGATAAYIDVVRGNRILSTAGAFVHGACVAILLQAIGFVVLVLVGQGSKEPTDFHLGPFHLVTIDPLVRQFNPNLLNLSAAADRMSAAATSIELLSALVAALVIVLASPRLWRAMR
jgi:hypothetical protein